jgi:hypothetical protein
VRELRRAARVVTACCESCAVAISDSLTELRRSTWPLYQRNPQPLPSPTAKAEGL